ncbi:MAG: glycosyltransferase family 4 protein [Bacilli bacterium]
MKKKVTFILGGLSRGGAEKVVSVLANDYYSKGWDVDIILLLLYEVGYELNENIKIIDFTNKGKLRVFNIPYWIKSIRNYVKCSNTDIVISFVARINIITQIACINLKKRVIVSERNDPRNDGRSILVDILTKILYPQASQVIFQTEYAKNYFQNLNNSVVIPNPIQIYAHASLVKSDKIVTVGRLAKQKNQELLIEAFKQVAKDNPQYKLEIYGDGNCKKILLNKIKMYDLEDNVFLQGNVQNIHERISDAKIFVLSSNYEGLSNALLEAMMMGIPCVSTNCSGIDEYVKNRIDGTLVPVGDSVKLAKAINELIADSELREKYSQQAIINSSKFKVENIINEWKICIERD